MGWGERKAGTERGRKCPDLGGCWEEVVVPGACRHHAPIQSWHALAHRPPDLRATRGKGVKNPSHQTRKLPQTLGELWNASFVKKDGDSVTLSASRCLSWSLWRGNSGGWQPTSKMAAGSSVPSPSAPAERGGQAPCTGRRGRRRRRRRGRRRRAAIFPEPEAVTLSERRGPGRKPRLSSGAAAEGPWTLGAASPSPPRSCGRTACPLPWSSVAEEAARCCVGRGCVEPGPVSAVAAVGGSSDRDGVERLLGGSNK